MATVQIVPGATAVELTARGSRSATLPPALETPPGGLFPLMSAAFEVDEYRIMSGWPVPVPVCDVRAPVLVSADGAVLDNRDAPTSADHQRRRCAGLRRYRLLRPGGVALAAPIQGE